MKYMSISPVDTRPKRSDFSAGAQKTESKKNRMDVAAYSLGYQTAKLQMDRVAAKQEYEQMTSDMAKAAEVLFTLQAQQAAGVGMPPQGAPMPPGMGVQLPAPSEEGLPPALPPFPGM